MKELRSLADAEGVRVDGPRLQSASPEEIRAGATTDVYFLKTLDILGHLGRAGVPVVADVFAQRPGILCGLEDVRALLAGRPLRLEALAEGEPFDAREVVLRLAGPYASFAIYETAILGMLASASGWATAAREVKRAAGDLPVTCYGSRHVHPAVAPVMERAAIVGGMDAASNVLGSRLAGRAPSGTIPHAAALIAGDTLAVAQAYDAVIPAGQSRTVLVDTFRDEAEEALRVAAALGDRLDAVRLDTPAERGGVTPDLVREVRFRLDLAGFGHVRVLVSGRVTPERIPELAAAGAAGFGVGSYVSAAAPIEMTLDLKEVDGRAIAKRGRLPGPAPAPRLRGWAL